MIPLLNYHAKETIFVVTRYQDDGIDCNENSTFVTWKQLSREKKPGWLGYVGDYTAQLYRDYNKRVSNKTPNNYSMEITRAHGVPFSIINHYKGPY